jgi:hypothetical protein
MSARVLFAFSRPQVRRIRTRRASAKKNEREKSESVERERKARIRAFFSLYRLTLEA